MRISFETSDDLRSFSWGENGWQEPRSFRADESLRLLDFDPQHESIQEKDRAGGLILSRGAHLALCSEI